MRNEERGQVSAQSTECHKLFTQAKGISDLWSKGHSQLKMSRVIRGHTSFILSFIQYPTELPQLAKGWVLSTVHSGQSPRAQSRMERVKKVVHEFGRAKIMEIKSFIFVYLMSILYLLFYICIYIFSEYSVSMPAEFYYLIFYYHSKKDKFKYLDL